MHSKSDCRLLWRVAADMFIVAVAVGAEVVGVCVCVCGVGVGGGRSLTSQFLKLPVYMEVKQMETLGCGQLHPPTKQPPKSPNTHTHQCQRTKRL